MPFGLGDTLNSIAGTLRGGPPLLATVLGVLVAAAGLATSVAQASQPVQRAYEMVTPADKKGTDAVYGLPMFASADGNQMVWASITPLLDSRNGTQNQYRADRGPAGWSSKSMSLPIDAYHSVDAANAFFDFACDGCSSLIGTGRESGDPGDTDPAPFGAAPDVYTSDGLGTAVWLSRGSIGGDNSFADAVYGGRSADGSRVVFTLAEALEPDATAVSPGLQVAYAHSGGQTEIVGRSDDGSVMPGGSIIAGAGEPGSGQRNAISGDGSRIVFASPDPASGSRPHLYVRVDGTETVEVSAPQCTRLDCGTGEVHAYQGASTDGSKVFFTSMDQLVDDDADAFLDVYRYDFATQALTRISGGEDGLASSDDVRYLANSEDGTRVYFIASGALTSTPNGRGQLPQPDQPDQYNLYVHTEDPEHVGGETRFVGTLDNGLDVLNMSSLVGVESARAFALSAGGDISVFTTSSPLLGPVGGHKQVYRYHAETDELTCVSCPLAGVPTGSAGTSLAQGITGGQAWSHRRSISGDGSRVFFETTQPLAPGDANGETDVYQWTAQGQSLISSGRSSRESLFIDASADGESVFFSTYERLLEQDDDGAADVYAARVGGGFPAPGDPTECAGDGCQGTPRTAPRRTGDATSGPGRSGNAGSGDRLRLGLGAISVKARQAFARRGIVRVRVRVNGGARVSVVARGVVGGRRRTLGRASAARSGPGSVVLTVRLSKAARSRLSTGRGLRLTLTASARGAVPRTTSMTLTRKGR